MQVGVDYVKGSTVDRYITKGMKEGMKEGEAKGKLIHAFITFLELKKNVPQFSTEQCAHFAKLVDENLKIVSTALKKGNTKAAFEIIQSQLFSFCKLSDKNIVALKSALDSYFE